MPAIAVAGAVSASSLSARIAADHDVLALAAGAVDDGDGLVLAGRSLLGRGFRGLLGVAGSAQRRPSRPPPGVLRKAMCATGSPPKGLSVNRAMVAKPTRNRPSSTASACIAVNGSRNRRFLRLVSCPSGVLSSSAVSVMNLPESTAPKIPRWAGFERSRPRSKAVHPDARDSVFERSGTVRVKTRQNGRNRQQKGRPEGRPFHGNWRGSISSPPWWRACRSPPCRRSRAPWWRWT